MREVLLALGIPEHAHWYVKFWIFMLGLYFLYWSRK